MKMRTAAVEDIEDIMKMRTAVLRSRLLDPQQ